MSPRTKKEKAAARMFLTFVLFVFAFRFSVSVSRSLGLKRRTRNNDTNINHNHNFSLFAQRADFLLLLLLLARVRAEARLSCKARLNLAKTAIHIISSEQMNANSTRLEIRNRDMLKPSLEESKRVFLFARIGLPEAAKLRRRESHCR